ncbi:hypothetical protein BDF20DRAFT_189467 [Mycotypha africana]|uniref:uncharacterized protein n=1 Tax=Mycotypha africana TaxID=64632 RepID=UPI002301D8C0|nr:uncharacterized protein BDF20DRAFT_189467 [Mycotypha africana]KAI8968587.1 hypothetical protein BDF20DRAFT_189467 [Mycotypha africana]
MVQALRQTERIHPKEMKSYLSFIILYFFLWWCEKALPYLDDWLFAFVTITIPKAYEQTEQWWLQRGKPAYLKRKAYIKQVIFPSIIDKLEKFFLSLYKASCVAQNGIKEFVAALNKFIKRHDWQQLMEDLGNIVYDRFWIPSTLVLTRAINLYKFIYAGIRATVISIVNEAKWICTVAIPTAYQYIVSTRLAKAVYNGSVWIKEKLQLLFTLLNTYILAPTVGRLLTGIVKAIDKLILLLQQRTFQKKLAKLYRIYGPKLVWVTVEISGILFDSMALVRHFWAELLYPAYRLFVKHVKPRLSIAYKSFATCIDHWLRSKVFPAWIRLYPYLNIPLFWVYMNLALPLYCEIYTIQSTAAACISQNLAGKIWSVMSTIIELVAVYAKEVYTLLQLWLMKQAPVLSRILQKSYETIRSSCNWTSLQQDILYTASQFYDWMAKQINNIYLSMERSLNSWVEEQQEEIGDISLEKRKEVGSNESYSVEPNHG